MRILYYVWHKPRGYDVGDGWWFWGLVVLEFDWGRVWWGLVGWVQRLIDVIQSRLGGGWRWLGENIGWEKCWKLFRGWWVQFGGFCMMVK